MGLFPRNVMAMRRFVVLLLVSLSLASCSSGFYQRKPVFKSNRLYIYTIPDAAYPDDARMRAQLKPVQALPDDAAEAMLTFFTRLRYEKKNLIGSVNEYVFSPDQLREIAPVLKDVLKARPEGVRFLLVTQYDRFHTVLSKNRRTSILFWSDGESLHLVFGELNTDLVGDDFTQDEHWLDIFPVNMKRAPANTAILEDASFTYGKMGDFTHRTWLVVPLSGLAAIQADPQFYRSNDLGRTGEKTQDVDKPAGPEARLKRLDDLKSKGLISEKEYEAQRARILSDL